MEESRIKHILDKNTDENNQTIDKESLIEFLKSTPVDTYEFVFHDEDTDQTNHVRVSDADILQTFMGEHMNANGTYLAILDKLDNCDVSKLKVKPIIIFTTSQQSLSQKDEDGQPSLSQKEEEDGQPSLLQEEEDDELRDLNNVDSEKQLQTELKNVLNERNQSNSEDAASESIIGDTEEAPVTDAENKPVEPIDATIDELANNKNESDAAGDGDIEEEKNLEEPIVESVVTKEEEKPAEPIDATIDGVATNKNKPDAAGDGDTNSVDGSLGDSFKEPPNPPTSVTSPPTPPPRPLTPAPTNSPEVTNLIDDNEMKFEGDSNKVKLPDWMGGKKNKRKSKKQKTKKKNQKARKTKKNLSRQKKTKKPKKTKK